MSVKKRRRIPGLDWLGDRIDRTLPASPPASARDEPQLEISLRSFDRWTDRQPWWVQVLVLPFWILRAAFVLVLFGLVVSCTFG